MRSGIGIIHPSCGSLKPPPPPLSGTSLNFVIHTVDGDMVRSKLILEKLYLKLIEEACRIIVDGLWDHCNVDLAWFHGVLA